MKLLMLPNDILYYFTRFLSTTEKMSLRETNKELCNNVRFMDIRIDKMSSKFDKLMNGRQYILCRLRLAALYGLQDYTVASIWSWVTLLGDIKTDALPILRQISSAIS